jgi:hypothetical protein
MTPAGFQPTIAASGRMQTQGLDRAANGIGDFYNIPFRRIHKIAKSDLLASHLYVCAHGTSRLTLQGFSLNFMSIL